MRSPEFFAFLIVAKVFFRKADFYNKFRINFFCKFEFLWVQYFNFLFLVQQKLFLLMFCGDNVSKIS